jgi:hypothetical protein
MQAQLFLQKFLNRVQLGAVVHVHVNQPGPAGPRVELEHVFEVDFNRVPVLVYRFGRQSIDKGGIDWRCFDMHWLRFEGKEVDYIGEALFCLFLPLGAVDEARLDLLGLEIRTEGLSGGSSPNYQGIFMLELALAAIALLNSKDIGVDCHQLPRPILEDSIRNPVFQAYLAPLLNHRLVSKDSLVGNGDGHAAKGVLLHLFKSDLELGVWRLVGWLPALELEEEVMDSRAKGGLNVLTNQIVLHQSLYFPQIIRLNHAVLIQSFLYSMIKGNYLYVAPV